MWRSECCAVIGFHPDCWAQQGGQSRLLGMLHFGLGLSGQVWVWEQASHRDEDSSVKFLCFEMTCYSSANIYEVPRMSRALANPISGL